MAICPVCGEAVEDDASSCPFCESPLEPTEPPRIGTVTVNLKDDLPTVDRARARLDAVIGNHRSEQTAGLVLIHGYGSGGVGGKIREMVRLHLRSLRSAGEIKDFVFGEDLARTPRVRLPSGFKPGRAEIGNPGITVVRL